MKRLALCPLVALVLAGCQDTTQLEVRTRVRPRPSTIVAATSTSAAPFAYVTNLFSNTVSVIETATNTVVATVECALDGWLWRRWDHEPGDGYRRFHVHDHGHLGVAATFNYRYRGCAVESAAPN